MEGVQCKPINSQPKVMPSYKINLIRPCQNLLGCLFLPLPYRCFSYCYRFIYRIINGMTFCRGISEVMFTQIVCHSVLQRISLVVDLWHRYCQRIPGSNFWGGESELLVSIRALFLSRHVKFENVMNYSLLHMCFQYVAAIDLPLLIVLHAVLLFNRCCHGCARNLYSYTFLSQR